MGCMVGDMSEKGASSKGGIKGEIGCTGERGLECGGWL